MSRSRATAQKIAVPCSPRPDLVPGGGHPCEWQKTHFAPAVKQQLFARRAIRSPWRPDNHPGAYFWRLTNGKVPKTFHMEDTKWWLLELIPIELQKGK